MSADAVRREILRAAAVRMARDAFAEVHYDDIARDVGLEPGEARSLFGDKAEIANAILDHERASMRTAMAEIIGQSISPLHKIIQAFESVGENCERDILVRAGVRLATESRQYFPHRRLDPFETWQAFVRSQLMHARGDGTLRDVDIEDTVWVLVSAGMGAKALIALHDSWQKAGDRMADTARTLVRLITTSRDNEAVLNS